MYHNGEGVKRDLSKAKEWFRKACDKGNKRLVIL
ncbi:SEL1-like repeat protein [Haemophilus influenzae]|nr:SEL1-like repeat protein [Haemophilus influenzae]MCK8808437.1 SEL1-like repeat protein [Haemophilus influenzae]MCK8809343.1 SEL1-like repeat protein [Haemophilus influenzae]MCK8883266.1 SEL1-like repeat protein [Haemophilus influenzae]MCK9069398.1 SEL1-like repeat protein [Haemophilus influenzae]MCK9154315.1 SEL1-like repeat protein [Haemophilus influenzae]